MVTKHRRQIARRSRRRNRHPSLTPRQQRHERRAWFYRVARHVDRRGRPRWRIVEMTDRDREQRDYFKRITQQICGAFGIHPDEIESRPVSPFISRQAFLLDDPAEFGYDNVQRYKPTTVPLLPAPPK